MSKVASKLTTTMIRPAEYTDSNDSDDYGNDFGYTCGSSSGPKRNDQAVPAVPTAQSLQKIRHLNVIEIIADGRLDDLDVLCSGDLRHNFDVNEVLCNEWTPLVHACFHAQYNAIDILLASGADPNKQCSDTGPLMVACASAKDPDVVQRIVALLLHKGAVVNVSNRWGQTPLMFACMVGLLSVVTQLLQTASLQACDNLGNSALFHAIENKHFEITQLLLERGASTEIKNNEGFNAKEWAIHTGFVRIEELIPTVVQYMVPNEFGDYATFADFAPTALKSVQPAYFPDVMNMIRSLDSDDLLEIFATSKICLLNFLTLTDERLIELGVTYPFERNRILFGLFKFHLNPWSPKSLRIFDQKDTTFDLFYILSGYLKQMLILECTVVYVTRNDFDHNGHTTQHLKRIGNELEQLSQKLLKIRERVKQIHQNAVLPPLLVSNKRVQTPTSSSKKLKSFLKYSTLLAVCGVCCKWLRDTQML